MKQLRKFLILPALLASILLLSGCERPPIEAVQHGYRGTAMDLIYNPRILAEQAEKNAVPVSYGPASADGPKAGAVYKNVKVLNNLSVAQFSAFMVSMTSWVAPEQGCAYCHNTANFADESLYTKQVSRNMLSFRADIGRERLAGMLFLIHGQAATYQIGWTTPTGRETNAHHLMLWRGIEELQQRGVRL